MIVSIMHANNEIGTRSDLDAIGALCRKYNALFHSDTVQTMGHYTCSLATLPVDFITCAAHKFHGPKGVGFLFMRNSSVLKPISRPGGAQERNMRAGTENLHGIVGLAKALEIAYRDLGEHQRHIQTLKDRMMQRLKEKIPGVGFNGDASNHGLYTVLSVCFPENGRSEMLLYNLDIEGVACSGGSACSSGSNTGSHVLRTLYPERPGANIRFSFSRFNSRWIKWLPCLSGSSCRWRRRSDKRIGRVPHPAPRLHRPGQVVEEDIGATFPPFLVHQYGAIFPKGFLHLRHLHA